jgi:hypothetical protein
LSLVSVVATEEGIASAGHVINVFSPLLKRWTRFWLSYRLWQPHLHFSEISMNLYRTRVFSSWKFSHHYLPNTNAPNIRQFTLLLYWTWLTGEPMIHVELEVAAIKWVKQESPPDVIIGRENLGGLTLVPNFLPKQRRPQDYNSKNLLPSTHFRVLVNKTPL